jgi:hypothetical protein
MVVTVTHQLTKVTTFFASMPAQFGSVVFTIALPKSKKTLLPSDIEY